MARRKVTCALQLENWQQADDALRQIGENRRDLAAIENVMNERIADAKADAEAKGRPIKDHIAMLEQALREFATLHRADLGKAKSRTLTFGKVGFRQSTRLTLPRGAEKVKTIIEELLRRGMKECVVYPEPKIDKDALKKYSAIRETPVPAENSAAVCPLLPSFSNTNGNAAAPRIDGIIKIMEYTVNRFSLPSTYLK